MAFFDCHFFSDILGLTVSAYVLLPQKTARQIGLPGAANHTAPAGGYPVLTLLHGLSDDHTIWMRRTSIERYAAARNLAVIMPAAGRSFYQDMASGARHWTFLNEELPAMMRSWFPLSAARESNYVAGLSMGGYGALRLALANPDRYAAAAGLSGALDLARRCREAGRQGSLLSRVEMESIFGAELKVEGTGADLFALARSVAGAPPLQGSRASNVPALYLSCGAQDGLLPENRAFHQHLDALKWKHAYSEPPGAHEWAVWDAEIQRVVDWLPGLPK
ncbi:MAG TPA: alpha/beta hydrolase family protein [Chthoniobacteraceae bacterium]|jgi:S-formylglutathione hydrolase FrmB|nr:alpha/beta hydrolase family protein [Chthoniobacteraceae bacterium]